MIYQATMGLVMKHGFTALKMADVAAEAGLATGTVYIYFKDKETLINQLYNYIREKSTGLYAERIDEEDSFRKSLRRSETVFNFSLEHSAEAAFLEQYQRSPYLTGKSKKENNLLMQPFLELLSRGQQEKRLVKLEKEVILSLMIGPVHEMIRSQTNGSLKITPTVIDSTFELIWESVKR
ncbi:MAG: TetR/AcrR family transcriptional regulator [Bacteroidetes bacterium]|nr:TetR/AcrR family transcriptional regulator [Bacteroidota bacterium]